MYTYIHMHVYTCIYIDDMVRFYVERARMQYAKELSILQVNLGSRQNISLHSNPQIVITSEGRHLRAHSSHQSPL